jgi:Flp pilus assembly protein TadD
MTPVKFNRFWDISLVSFIMLILILSIATYQRNKIWSDDLSLWSDIVRKSPHKPRAYHYFGLAFHDAGNFDQAIATYKKSLSLNPLQADVHNNIGVSYFYRGDVDTAISHFKHAIRINPSHADAHYNLGIAYGEKGLFDLAHEEINKGMKLNR